jgi:hypothetical protein
VLISLGINDGIPDRQTPAHLVRLRVGVHAGRVYWVLPARPEVTRRLVRAIAQLCSDRLIETKCPQNLRDEPDEAALPDRSRSRRAPRKGRRCEAAGGSPRRPCGTLAFNHEGRGWWDPQSTAKGDVFDLVQHLNPGLNFRQVRQVLRRFVGVAPRLTTALLPLVTPRCHPPHPHWTKLPQSRPRTDAGRHVARLGTSSLISPGGSCRSDGAAAPTACDSSLRAARG